MSSGRGAGIRGVDGLLTPEAAALDGEHDSAGLHAVEVVRVAAAFGKHGDPTPDIAARRVDQSMEVVRRVERPLPHLEEATRKLAKAGIRHLRRGHLEPDLAQVRGGVVDRRIVARAPHDPNAAVLVGDGLEGGQVISDAIDVGRERRHGRGGRRRAARRGVVRRGVGLARARRLGAAGRQHREKCRGGGTSISVHLKTEYTADCRLVQATQKSKL